MSTPDIYRELESSAWNDINPFKCPCRGGWLLSDFDTWHRCKTHGVGVPHPEDESGEHVGFDHGTHGMKVCRTAYATFRDMARRNGFKGNFKHACLKVMVGDDRSPKAWVNAADVVANECRYDAEERTAKARGFSCGLEARLADYAAEERWEREHGCYN